MRAAYEHLLKIEAVLAATLLILMVVLIFAGGVGRMLHHPLNWTIDLSTCFFAWACFLCADIAWRKDALMSIDALPAAAPRAVRRALLYVNYLILIGFLSFVIYSGVYLSIVSRARSFQGIAGVSYSWVTMSLPVGGTLLLMTTLVKLRRAWTADAGRSQVDPR